MKTSSFRTKSMILERENISLSDVWGIAVDIGYSGTKIYAPNCIACFPSFAVQVKGNLLQMAATDESTIYYKDADGVVWKVGKAAQDSISPQDPDTASMAIYGRQRYFDPMFLVIARTAIGIASRKNNYGDPTGKKVRLETGLPNSYIRADRPLLKEVLAGEHVFDLKIGSGQWEHCEITLTEDDIFVMPQPMGTLLSVSTDNNGITAKGVEDLYTSAVLICDPGFGTMDCFSLRGSEMDGVETSDSLGMKQVLIETSNTIFRKYRVEIPVPAMQKVLEDGYITQFDRATRRGKNVEIDGILEEANRKIANKAIDKLSELYNSLLEYKYLILTGGTGEAWYDYFVEAFSGLPNLTILPGNQNTDGMMFLEDGTPAPLPFIFSNVRGYYMYLQNKLRGETV